MMKTKFTTVAILATLIASANAAIVVTNHHSSDAYTVSANDVLSGLIPVVTGTPILDVSGNERFTTSNPTILTDGILGSANPNEDTPPVRSPTTLTVEGGTIMTYTLSNSGPGITIGSVQSYGGWRDPGRDAQRFSLSYATVANPLIFLPIATVDFNPTEFTFPSNTRVSITDDLDGVLAEGVGSLRFSFSNQESGYAGYREFDVIAAIPEPSAAALALLSASGLFLRRKRSAP
jgi:hypothetical protein